ncbi:conserved hypothetical protein [Candidatus Sulfotelmatobacter kueseliae]|uniref:Uncharacterized protein n=1 Tax=Candidatus Sulfotelmatobacter kueseliae TaxID=2042962 RepID=A0A2U3K502_9BACT|nr:conserved hypothetical protein [Candidatus Sulfotelmatobacter kueseliae]
MDSICQSCVCSDTYTRTISEELFVQFCAANTIPWELVPTGTERTPDFRIRLGNTQVICEVKQIDPNAEDVAELEELGSSEAVGRLVPNRMRDKLKDSAQLKAASHDGRPTLLVVYDNTPIKMYTFHSDVAQAMFGRDSVRVSVSGDETVVSEPFFGGNRGLTPSQNTSVSALAILDGGPNASLSLRVYHNPYARVLLRAELFAGLPVTQFLLPGETAITL